MKAIDALPEAQTIWGKLYDELVLNCVNLIKAGENEKAYELYKSTAMELKEKYRKIST